MLPLWLNRAGIILSFLAGFLVAPELLGIRRLEWADARLERFVAKGRERLKFGGYISKGALGRAFRSNDASFVALILLISALFCLSLWWVWHTRDVRWAIIPLMLYLVVAGFVFLFAGMAPGITTLQMLLLAIAAPLPHLIWAPFWTVRRLVAIVARVAIDKLLGPLLRMLEAANSRVRLLLVPLGIACFILGNLLQFIATFL